MKRLILIVAAICCLFVGVLAAKTVNVKGYYRKDGTYVAPHTRSSPGSKSRSGPTSPETFMPPSTNTSGSTKAAKPEAHVGATKPLGAIVGWSSLVFGMQEAELKRQLGEPTRVEKRNGFDSWVYPNGSVFVKDGSVLAWQEAKANPPAASTSGEAGPKSDARQTTVAKEAAAQPKPADYWITLSSGVRHNSNCRYYQNSRGRKATKDEGRACKLCGG